MIVVELTIELIIGLLLIASLAEIIMAGFYDPIPGDIIVWRGKTFKVVNEECYDSFDYVLIDEKGAKIRATEWDLYFAHIKGLGIQRMYRYFREITGI